MKLLIVSFSFDDHVASATEQLAIHDSTDELLCAMQENGLVIECYKRFHTNELIEKKGICYYFCADGFKGQIPFWYPALNFIRIILSRNANVIHIHGIHFPFQTFLLKLLSNKNTKVIVQHHGGNPEFGIKGWLKRKLLSIADAFFFTTSEQGMSWFFQKISSQKIFPVMEGASNMKRGDKQHANDVLGLQGDHRFVWIGRLYQNKDPLTVLAGFEMFCKEHPSSKLYMIYQTTDLLNEVKDAINKSTLLQQSLELVGRCTSTQIEQYLNAADYFVLGSHYEGSGYALSEAIACGCIPIVTDIPSFRMMTNQGKMGGLWEKGNPRSFYEALMNVIQKDKLELSDQCVAFYQSTLSVEAIARISTDYYRQLSSITDEAV
ncbi:MAG: glycosyltransferase [Bacteroidetes bacterium]|nr:glycosyltransferase [Bacteroidota bacterium]